MCHITEWAATSADIAHDHEGRGTMPKAFTEIRAVSFLADRVSLRIFLSRLTSGVPGDLALIQAGLRLTFADGWTLIGMRETLSAARSVRVGLLLLSVGMGQGLVLVI